MELIYKIRQLFCLKLIQGSNFALPSPYKNLLLAHGNKFLWTRIVLYTDSVLIKYELEPAYNGHAFGYHWSLGITGVLMQIYVSFFFDEQQKDFAN